MGIVDCFATANKLIVEIPNAELKASLLSAVVAAQGAALELQARVGELQDENSSLKDQLRKRDEDAAMKDQVHYARNAFWKKGDSSNTAFCPNCLKGENKQMHLQRTNKTSGYCCRCNEVFEYVYDGPRPQEGDEATPHHKDTSLGKTGPDLANRTVQW